MKTETEIREKEAELAKTQEELEASIPGINPKRRNDQTTLAVRILAAERAVLLWVLGEREI